jgi:hypothetical protein
MALAIYARRARDRFVATIVGKPLLIFLRSQLSRLKTPLRLGALDNLNDEQLNELACMLKQLNTSLTRVVDDSNLRSYATLRNVRAGIQQDIEDIESIVENIYLVLDPTFHKAVSSAIDSLNLGVEERAALLR